MPITVVTTDLPKAVRESVTDKVRRALSDTKGNWTVSVRPDLPNNAWEVQVRGPQKTQQWERRFYGDDRDGAVIAETVRNTLEESGEETKQNSKVLNDALGELAIQGIAFLSKANETGENVYVVDRVQLKESEIIYLYKQQALTRRGIQRYLLNRQAA
jgi:hypothetical protein